MRGSLIAIKGGLHLKQATITGGVMGVIIGDALGLPVQFMTKTEIRKNPITEMTGGGAFGLEPGAWSEITIWLLAGYIFL